MTLLHRQTIPTLPTFREGTNIRLYGTQLDVGNQREESAITEKELVGKGAVSIQQSALSQTFDADEPWA